MAHVKQIFALSHHPQRMVLPHPQESRRLGLTR